MERLSFPEHLRGRSFRRRQARLAGVYDAELLRRTDLLRPAHGVWTTEETESTVGRCRAILPLLPEGSAYSHVTAGELHALPLPSRLLAQTELDVMTRTEEAQRRRVGWNGHRGAESREILDLDGLPVTGLVDTWCDLAENAVGRRARMGTDDLVVLGDEVLNRLILDALKEMDPWEQPTGRWHLDGDLVATTLAQLDAVIAARVRPRGKRAMTAARALLRAGVRSPQESRARLVFAHAGFPDPGVNVEVFDDEGGWLGEGDLVWREQRVVVEYQGEYHADRAQRSKDSSRAAAFGHAGWTTHEMWAEDVRPGTRRAAFLRRVAWSLGLGPCHLENT
jgi:hypothetical protein